MSVLWGTLESHDQAWQAAKQELGIEDVRDLSREQFSRALQRAEQIRQKENATDGETTGERAGVD
jgi:hypothetical protein